MGLNTVCAYLFWNFHQWDQGRFDWSGQADAAEFCRLAQQEGLWVILRPGPYACAEWEMGGLPWWLLKKEGIQLRSRDPDFLAAGRAWLKEVGRVLGPMQITRGGPILMVQVENEYGFYGSDVQYMGEIRQALVDAGFDVPLFACNPPYALRKGLRDDLFNVVNFGKDPADGFKALRADPAQGAPDVRGVLSGLVRYLGLPAPPGQHAAVPGGPGVHAQEQRLVQHLHGPRGHDLWPVVRSGPAVQARHFQLRLRCAHQRSRVDR